MADNGGRVYPLIACYEGLVNQLITASLTHPENANYITRVK